MGGGETIVGFSLLMMKSMTAPVSVSAADSIQKFAGSSKSLALTTTGDEALLYCTSYFSYGYFAFNHFGTFNVSM